MKIKTVTQQPIIIEKEINLPYFFRVLPDKVGAIYSEERSIEVNSNPLYSCIVQCSFSILWENSVAFRSEVEITEQEFNSVMAKVFFAVAGIEIVNDINTDPCISSQS